ncbi:preprotein translocase subunit SecG [Patescibacteria group bacterium]|nr:preprotein translocase subunit SecG [Patescibacteria group bacterium]MCG2702337.1 preprotein translocase subunit SecG [Candidatus Parcubacteria bacterium]MBU4209906.1 preprotein translocase subunit SecG [Patescibacteria group bacterium]MBU4264973.1 preprotein translocase subunit SecG [Patescibacteria group bacterium]MBU4389810.1 preprotein translocase subunit SecG [Patescibacteria group bacterium]
MKNILTIIQIVLSILLTSLVFLQNNSNQNSQSNIIAPIQNQKRGWEKMIFIFTITTIMLFLISSIIQTTLV